jgi:hypothetical protein
MINITYSSDQCHVKVTAILLIFGKFQRHAYHLSIDFP